MTNRGKQRTVREGQFDRAMEEFNREIAVKTTLTMAKFHDLYVAPLEARLLLVETLLGIRLLRWIKGWLLKTFTEPVEEVAAQGAEEEPADAHEPAAEHESNPFTPRELWPWGWHSVGSAAVGRADRERCERCGGRGRASGRRHDGRDHAALFGRRRV